MTKRLWLPAVILAAVLGLMWLPGVLAQSPMGEQRQIGLELVADGLTAPVTMAVPPDDSGRLFVVDQIGLIRIIDENGTLLEEPFLDTRDRQVEPREGFDERGLLGLAFHPDYEENGRFFVYYSAPLRERGPEGWDHTAHISEFQVSEDDPNRADPDSERIILEVDEPQFNHDGGTVLFGPEDGYLYISLGDGGGANDNAMGHVSDWYLENEGGNAQNIQENLLGKVLRIDVDNGEPYAIPDDNPFVGTPARDEIYAYGFRNPYRLAFDMEGDNELFALDAGQELWEEISIVEAGGNYGWNVKEGTHCFNTETPTESRESCPDTVGPPSPDEGNVLTDPVIEVPNAKQEGGLGLTVTGGQVYRGDALPELDGHFIFGTWSMVFDQPMGRIFGAERTEDGLWEVYELIAQEQVDGTLGRYVLGVGQDEDGEVYVLTSRSTAPEGETGEVWRLVPEGEGTPMATPQPGDGPGVPGATPTVTPTPGATPTVPPTPGPMPVVPSTPSPTPAPNSGN